jgi:hypothetical protein
MEKGYLNAAINLLQSGMNIQDIVRMLRLSDVQAHEVKSRANLAG